MHQVKIDVTVFVPRQHVYSILKKILEIQGIEKLGYCFTPATTMIREITIFFISLKYRRRLTPHCRPGLPQSYFPHSMLYTVTPHF